MTASKDTTHNWILLGTWSDPKDESIHLSRCTLCAVVRVADGYGVIYFGAAGEATDREKGCGAWGSGWARRGAQSPDDTDLMYCSVSDAAARLDCDWNGAWAGVE